MIILGFSIWIELEFTNNEKILFYGSIYRTIVQRLQFAVSLFQLRKLYSLWILSNFSQDRLKSHLRVCTDLV